MVWPKKRGFAHACRDVDNVQGYAEAYKEVIHEDAKRGMAEVDAAFLGEKANRVTVPVLLRIISRLTTEPCW